MPKLVWLNPYFQPTWRYIQSATGVSSGTGVALTVPLATVAAGNRIIVAAEINENTGTGTGAVLNVGTSSGSAGLGTWRPVVQTANLSPGGGFSVLGALWTVPVLAGGSLTVKASGGNVANAWQLSAAVTEYAGLSLADSLAAVDVSAVSVWDPGTFQVVSGATSVANGL